MPRKALAGFSVPNMCHEILKSTPADKSTEADLKSKFSLYLLGQLIYGTALIFDRQTTLFLHDVRSAYEGCKRLPMDELHSYGVGRDGEDALARKRHRRAKITVSDFNPLIDIDETPGNRCVQLARRSDITMPESEPVIWQRPDVFFDEGPQLPINFSKEHFINWNDQRSSQSSKESIQKVDDNEKRAAAEPVAPEEELPPFPPPDAFLNMDRETFMAGSVVDVTKSEPVNTQEKSVSANLETQQEPVAKRPRLDRHDGDHIQQERLVAIRSEAPIIELHENREGVHKASFELSPVNTEELTELHHLRRRKKHLQSLDRDGSMISYETMKKLQLDYSSIIKTKEELHSGMTTDKYPTLHELLLPYPAYAGNRFPKECIQLYRSRVCDTMTYKQALTEGIFDAVDRGPASKLWRYRSHDSSTESSISDLLPGIAWLNETPARFRDEIYGRENRSSEGREGLHTPGKISLQETPQRYKEAVHNERLSELSLRPNDPLANEPLQLAADISFPENTRFRESRSSYVEEARRMTIGTNEFDRRPSSFQLFEPFRPGDISQQSIQSGSGRISLPDSLKEKFQTEECRCLLEALSNASGFVALSSVIPTAITSKRRAAGVFSSLLLLLHHSVVEVEQDEAYGEIWMRAYPVSGSSGLNAEE